MARPRLRTRTSVIAALAAVPLAVGLLTAPANAETVFALVDTGELFASTDQGATWAVASALPVSDAAGLVAGTSALELYLASGTGTIYASVDGGTSWNATGSVTASDVVAIHIRPDGNLLALTQSGLVFESPDAVTFTAVSSITASDMVSLSRRPGPIYALARTGAVSRSDDDGQTWTTTGSITASDAVEIVSLVGDVYVITSTGDVWASSDSGASWNAVATLSQVHTSSLVRSFAGTFYATTREGSIARSTNGVDWSWVGTTNQLNVVALATDEAIVSVPGSAPSPASLLVGLPRPNPLGANHALVGFDVTVETDGLLELSLFDVAGRRLRLQRVHVSAGVTRIETPVSRLGSGVYFAHLAMGGASRAQRFVVRR